MNTPPTPGEIPPSGGETAHLPAADAPSSASWQPGSAPAEYQPADYPSSGVAGYPQDSYQGAYLSDQQPMDREPGYGPVDYHPADSEPGYPPGYATPGYPATGYQPIPYGPTDGSPFSTGVGGYAYQGAPARWNNTAIASLVLGITGLVLILPAIAAIVCGHIALSQIKRAPNEQGRGLAIAGIALGWVVIAMLVLGMVSIVLMIALASGTLF